MLSTNLHQNWIFFRLYPKCPIVALTALASQRSAWGWRRPNPRRSPLGLAASMHTSNFGWWGLGGDQNIQIHCSGIQGGNLWRLDSAQEAALPPAPEHPVHWGAQHLRPPCKGRERRGDEDSGSLLEGWRDKLQKQEVSLSVSIDFCRVIAESCFTQTWES